MRSRVRFSLNGRKAAGGDITELLQFEVSRSVGVGAVLSHTGWGVRLDASNAIDCGAPENRGKLYARRPDESMAGKGRLVLPLEQRGSFSAGF